MKNISTILLLGLIAVVGVFTLDVYLPAMPAMAKDFDVSLNRISFTFIGFSVVFSIAQLFHGLLSDYLGRKSILLGGLAVAAIATLCCIYAKTYETLLAARLLQAGGISVFVVVNAIIRDLYTGKKAVRVRTFVATVSGVSISIAPTIGGLLQSRFNWQGGFMVSLLLIVFTFLYALLFFTESSSKKNTSSLSFTSGLKSYLQMFADSDYLRYVFIAALAYTVHFTFIIMSANIFINLLGFSPLTFGYLMFIYGGVYFVSGLLTGSLAKVLSIPTLIKLGGVFVGVGGILMLILETLIPINAWQILLPITLVTMGVTAVRASATTGALAPIPTQAGLGAAGLNLIQFMLSAAIAAAITQLNNSPQLSLSLLAIFSSVSIISLLNLNLIKRMTLIKDIST